MNAEFLVIGCGIAGAAAACALTREKAGRVVVLERESAPGYHSTGRSAALYTENYGNAVLRVIIKASKSFLLSPGAGFGDDPILTPRGALMIARADQDAAMDAALDFAHSTGVDALEVSKAEALAIHSGLAENYVARAMYEEAAMDIDVHALHQGYIRAFTARGGDVITDAEVSGLVREDGAWTVTSKAGTFSAPVIINAAGAWCDTVARLAGLSPVGIEAKRRTVITFDPPDGMEIGRWPMAMDVDEEFYFKPDAGRILASPADETPVPPQDVQPEEIDVATAAHRIEQATVMPVRRIESKWAGLRNFVNDKTPVVGMAPDGEGFLWLAGQGGYGIKTSPAMGRMAAALARGRPIPADIAVDPAALAPDRFVR